jgi:hypothetical protein
MTCYRRKPSCVEAVQLTQDAVTSHVLDKTPLPDGCIVTSSEAHPPTRQVHRAVVRLQTKERELVMPGDWIVRNADGVLSVCKPDIFAAVYEPAASPDEPAETIRELQTVMREVGSDLVENFVGEDAEERYGIQEHGKRLIRAANACDPQPAAAPEARSVKG